MTDTAALLSRLRERGVRAHDVVSRQVASVRIVEFDELAPPPGSGANPASRRDGQGLLAGVPQIFSS